MKKTLPLLLPLLLILAFSACSSQSGKSKGDSEIYFEIAKEYIAAGDLEKGLREVDNAIKTYPQNLNAYFLKLETLARAGRGEEALAVATEGEKHLTEETAYLKEHWLGTVYYHKGELRKAAEHFEASAGRNGDFAGNYELLGQVYTRMQKLNKAAENYARWTEVAPKSAKAWDQLGITYVWLRDYAKAKDALDSSLEADPENAQAYNYLGKWAEEQGKKEEGERYYRKSLELNDKDPFTNLNMGQLLMLEKRHKEAYPYLEKAAKERKDLPYPFYWLGEYFRREGDFVKGGDNFSRALSLDAMLWPARVGIAQTALDGGKDYENAVKLMKEGLEKDPSNQRGYFFYLAQLELAGGNPREALEYSDKVVSLLSKTDVSGLADSHLLRGKIHDKLGDKAKARSEYEEVVKLLPDSSAAEEARNLLKG